MKYWVAIRFRLAGEKMFAIVCTLTSISVNHYHFTKALYNFKIVAVERNLFTGAVTCKNHFPSLLVFLLA